jgi:hypothetical protein
MEMTTLGIEVPHGMSEREGGQHFLRTFDNPLLFGTDDLHQAQRLALDQLLADTGCPL